MCASRVGAAARVAIGSAGDLASCCEEATAHLVPETMTRVSSWGALGGAGEEGYSMC